MKLSEQMRQLTLIINPEGEQKNYEEVIEEIKGVAKEGCFFLWKYSLTKYTVQKLEEDGFDLFFDWRGNTRISW